MKKAGLLLLLLGGAFIASPVSLLATPLEDLDSAFIVDVQRNHRSVSHLQGLVNTIERILDCASNGRIDVSLIGLGDLPDHVSRFWSTHEQSPQEVSISRYRMALDAKNPEVRTDFYRLRSVTEGGKVVECLVQDIAKDHKAALVFRFVNGDPTGMHQDLAKILEELMSDLEEGFITRTAVPFAEVPLQVHKLWTRLSKLPADAAGVTAERFDVENAGGASVFWRVSRSESDENGGLILLVHHGKPVFFIDDSLIETFSH